MINTIYINHNQRRLYAMRGTFLLFTAILLLIVSFSGCSKGYSRFMKLPADSSVGSGLGWAAVTSAYAHAKKLPDATSEDISIVRRGTVFLCAERKIDPAGQDTGGLWYKFGEGSATGWIHSGDLSIFSSETQAREAAGLLQ